MKTDFWWEQKNVKSSSLTSHEGFLQIIYDLVVVADDGVPVEEDGHLLPQVEPHEPGFLVFLQR